MKTLDELIEQLEAEVNKARADWHKTDDAAREAQRFSYQVWGVYDAKWAEYEAAKKKRDSK